MSRIRGIAIILAMAVGAPTAAIAQRSQVDMAPMRMSPIDRPSTANQSPFQKKDASIEDLFPKTEVPYAYPNPVDLQGMTVGGLSEKNSLTLGTNLFVVIDNTKYNTVAELYRGNRLKGKSNFVTVDALMHSFLAVRNGMLATTIEEHAFTELSELLAEMLKMTAEDYKEADDAEVREDIERNLAFLNVAAKLLNPATPSVQLGSAAGLATKEMQNIQSRQKRKSAIFLADEDFSVYQPVGWYNSSVKLRNFYRAKTWLSRVTFPLAENTSNNGAGDSFRRSALLFRSLDRCIVGNTPGIQVWQRLNVLLTQLGPTSTTEIKTLTPADYKEVFKPANGNLKMSLQGLSEPFYRTKLLLSVRRQRPTQISSTSIFDLEAAHPERATQASFRIFPIVEPPELSWLRARGHTYVKEGSETPAPPLGLLTLHSHAIVHATNVLADNVWKLDPNLTQVVPSLTQTMKRQTQQDMLWQVYGAYFRMPVDAVQAVYKTNLWMTRKLLSGIGAWVDEQTAYAPPVPKKEDEDEVPLPKDVSATPAAARSATIATKTGAGSGGGASAKTGTAAGTTAPTGPVKHFIEPCPELFRNMRTETSKLATQLQTIGYATKKYDQRVKDLTALLQKLELIAQKQVGGMNLAPQDSAFLGDIDSELDKFSPPVAASIFLDTGDSNTNQQKRTTPVAGISNGANLILGRPAMAFILFQSGRTLTVARGAMYGYHELSGGPIKPEHLERKMDFGFLTPPAWAESFEVVQDQPPIGGN